MKRHGNKERRKSWLPQSNLLTSLFYPRHHYQQPSTDAVHKRRSHSLDQGNTATALSSRPDIYRSLTPPEFLHKVPSLTSSGTTLQQPPPTKRLSSCHRCANAKSTHSPHEKSTTFVGSLLSKAKRHPHLKRAATLIEAKANHYKKSTKDTDSSDQHRGYRKDSSSDNTDMDEGTTVDDLLLVSLFGVREDDVDRMQQKNDLIRLAFAGEFTRPMDESTIEKVLDIGCGPLCWSIDFAQTHPNAQVTGMDLIDMVPPDIALDLPKNCQLLLHNCIKEFPYSDNSVDLCHVRFMNVALTMDQYCKMVSHCWRVLKPGGYLELMEMDMLVYSPGPVTELLNQQVIELVRRLGLKPRLARYLRDVLPKEAGLTGDHITEFYRSLPIGVWGGRLGVLFRDDLIYALTHARSLGTAELHQSSNVNNGNTAALNDHHNNNNSDDGLTLTDQHHSHDESGRTDAPNMEEDDLFENQLLAAEKELEQCKSYSNFHFLRVQKPF